MSRRDEVAERITEADARGLDVDAIRAETGASIARIAEVLAPPRGAPRGAPPPLVLTAEQRALGEEAKRAQRREELGAIRLRDEAARLRRAGGASVKGKWAATPTSPPGRAQREQAARDASARGQKRRQRSLHG